MQKTSTFEACEAMPFRPPKSFIRDAAILGAISDKDIEAIEQLLNAESLVIQRPENLIATISEVIGLTDASILVRQLLPFTNMMVNDHDFANELDSVLDFIRSSGEPEVESAILGVSRLETLSSILNVRRTSKAIELSYDCSNLLQKTRILTDVRPLFSQDATSVEGAIVAHTFRVSYDSAGTDFELSFAVDEEDLRNLREQCDRALQKACTARNVFSVGNIPFFETTAESNK